MQSSPHSTFTFSTPRSRKRRKPGAWMMFNESFAATNEREGSEINRKMVSALLERQVRVSYVTHLYEPANGFYERESGRALFLRAERKPDGEPTSKLFDGRPLETSFGTDVYQQVFGGRAPHVTRRAEPRAEQSGG